MSIDLEALIGAPITEKLDTQFEVTPAGEYVAMISDRTPVKDWFRTVRVRDQDVPQCNILFIISDAEIAKAIGRREATSRLTLWLDVVEDGSRLDTGRGKNVGLGALRKALGQDEDMEWSFQKLVGAGPIRILTEVQESRSGGKFSNVTRVGKLGEKLSK
jgi:hypothetical protein